MFAQSSLLFQYLLEARNLNARCTVVPTRQRSLKFGRETRSSPAAVSKQ